MKHIKLTKKQLESIQPKKYIKFAIALWIGSDDILVRDGKEIASVYFEDSSNIKQKPNFLDILRWYIADISGNSFELITIKRDNIYIIDLPDNL